MRAAHVLLHADGEQRTGGCRGVREVEAESVAYLVTHAHGLDSGQYTFNYVAGWAAQAASDPADLGAVIAATGRRVIGAADRILRHTRTQPAAEAALIDALADHTPQPHPDHHPPLRAGGCAVVGNGDREPSAGYGGRNPAPAGA
ncbi:MAG: hypothetical protein IPL43_00195 [Micropruina sp.]|nr:hypothetical protein [Micropruina sp.]